MEDNNKIIIPEDVVNPKEYIRYVTLKRLPIMTDTIITTSNGDEINIGMFPHLIRRDIQHLSPQEQEDIMDRKRRWSVVRGKMSNAQAMAYGRAGRNGGKKKEELAKYDISPFEEDIIELLGRMFTTSEVVKIMGEDNGVITTEDEVNKILKKQIVEIERKREDFRNRLTDVRLYNKRPRLEELGWMFSKMKNRFIAFNSIDAYNAMLRTLEQIRKESEGDILSINGALDVNIEVTIQNHIQRDILKTINLKEIILGRVAARMNYDPNKLIAGLHNSYYAKFVDISGDYDENAEMVFPSTQAYDFTAIEKTAGKNVLDVTPEKITEDEKVTVNSVRSLFQEKIKRQKEEMERRTLGANVQAEIRGGNDVGEQVPIKRTAGRGKDKIPPSASKSKYKKNDRDYRTGKKKEE